MSTEDIRGVGMTSQRARDRLVRQLREQGIQSEPVLAAIRSTPRHMFVDEALGSRAYDNDALPIGHNQTISQPYIVARMIEALLGAGKPDKALEVGTGCGYQTAILAQFTHQVYSIERIAALLTLARKRFRTLNYRNIRVKYGDGNQGWPDHAPFQAILVAAASVEVPQALLQQLAVGGRMVIPIGHHGGEQRLLSIARTSKGFREKFLDYVSFVPMVEGKG